MTVSLATFMEGFTQQTCARVEARMAESIEEELKTHDNLDGEPSEQKWRKDTAEYFAFPRTPAQ